MQTGTAWNDILWKYNIKAKHTELHHPQQNPAERRIKTIKIYISNIMDHTGAPSQTWFLCLLYEVFLLNHTAVEALAWRTPIEFSFGQTTDLLPLLHFTFYEPVYYLNHKACFPKIEEQSGWFVGIAENKGNAPTYWILSDDNQLLARSVVQSSTAQELNKCTSKSTESLGSNAPDPATLDLMSDLVSGSADFDPVPYLGFSFVCVDTHGIPHE